MTAPDDSAELLFTDNRSPFPPWQVMAPGVQTAPVVFASPHSGRDYPPEFVAASKLNMLKLRRSEDAFMDEIFAVVVNKSSPSGQLLFLNNQSRTKQNPPVSRRV